MEKNFEPTLKFILREEGGYTVDHAGATQMGLTIGLMQKLGLDLDHDGDVDEADVKLVDADLVRRVFREQFWGPVGADILASGLDMVAADFCYNAGPQRAKCLLVHQDIRDYTLRRMQYYQALAEKNPQKYGKYLKGWLLRALKAWQAGVDLQASMDLAT
jgi:lysozyme family protein